MGTLTSFPAGSFVELLKYLFQVDQFEKKTQRERTLERVEKQDLRNLQPVQDFDELDLKEKAQSERTLERAGSGKQDLRNIQNFGVDEVDLEENYQREKILHKVGKQHLSNIQRINNQYK